MVLYLSSANCTIGHPRRNGTVPIKVPVIQRWSKAVLEGNLPPSPALDDRTHVCHFTRRQRSYGLSSPTILIAANPPDRDHPVFHGAHRFHKHVDEFPLEHCSLARLFRPVSTLKKVSWVELSLCCHSFEDDSLSCWFQFALCDILSICESASEAVAAAFWQSRVHVSQQ